MSNYLLTTLRRKGFSVFAATEDCGFDLIAIKDTSIIAIAYFKDLKTNPINYPEKYGQHINKFIDINLPYNFIKEIWIEAKEIIFYFDILNPYKVHEVGL